MKTLGAKVQAGWASLNPETPDQEARTWQAEAANSSGQDDQQVVFHAWVCRLNLMTFMTFGTGHAWTHRAQAAQASALTTYARLLQWTHAHAVGSCSSDASSPSMSCAGIRCHRD